VSGAYNSIRESYERSLSSQRRVDGTTDTVRSSQQVRHDVEELLRRRQDQFDHGLGANNASLANVSVRIDRFRVEIRDLNDLVWLRKSLFHHTHTRTHTHTHTHTHTFNGPFSGTTQVSRHQKGKTNLDFTEARDSGWQWRQLGHVQVCTSLQTDNHPSTPALGFLQAGCPSCRPTNSVKALKAIPYSQNSARIAGVVVEGVRRSG